MINKLSSFFNKNSPLQIIASSSRVYLREITKTDAQFMFNLMNQKNWLTYIGDKGISTLADSLAFIENGPVRSYKINGFGPYMVIDINSKESIGICGLLKRTYLDSPDLGFAISEQFYRKGYGYDAANLTLGMANTLTQAKYIYATVNKNNVGSISLLTNLGFSLQDSAGLSKLGSEADNLLLYRKDI